MVSALSGPGVLSSMMNMMDEQPDGLTFDDIPGWSAALDQMEAETRESLADDQRRGRNLAETWDPAQFEADFEREFGVPLEQWYPGINNPDDNGIDEIEARMLDEYNTLGYVRLFDTTPDDPDAS